MKHTQPGIHTHIEPVPESADPALIEAAQTVFRAYGEHLREIVACHGFNFERYALEIQDLPRAYTRHNGELLLATLDPGTPAGCIAFRVSAPTEPDTCELKRLFVLPAYRGRRLAEQLILNALDRARARGYRHAMLDTEPSSMPAAGHIYRKLGFVEFQPNRPGGADNVVFLRRRL